MCTKQRGPSQAVAVGHAPGAPYAHKHTRPLIKSAKLSEAMENQAKGGQRRFPSWLVLTLSDQKEAMVEVER